MGYSLPKLLTIEEFKQFQAQLVQNHPSGQWLVQLDISSTALACGANEIWQALARDLQAGKWPGVTLSATGSLGIDSAEPLLKLVQPGGSFRIYQRLNPERARRLLETALDTGQLPDSMGWDSL